jgi:prephenate dehydrogenase
MGIFGLGRMGVSQALAFRRHGYAGRSSHWLHGAVLVNTVGCVYAENVATSCGIGCYCPILMDVRAVEKWRGILMTNAQAVAEELRAFKMETERVYDDLQVGRFADVAAFLKRTRNTQAALLEGGTGGRAA